MSDKVLGIVPGINNSKAIIYYNSKSKDCYYRVYGAHNVLADQEDYEYAYIIDQSQIDWTKLEIKTPIYASVSQFEDEDYNSHIKNEIEYETIQDFENAAKSIIKDLTEENKIEQISANYQLKGNLINSKQAIKSLVNTLLNYLTWQELETGAIEIYQDITDSPESYPELFIKRENYNKH